MALLPLSEYLLQVPVLDPGDSLWAVAEVLGKAAADYGIVLSSEQRPLGLVKSSRLLSYFTTHPSRLSRAASSSGYPGEADEARLDHYLGWIEPVHLMPERQPWTEDAIAVAQMTQQVWVLVDSQQTYLGVLSRERLTPLLSQGQKSGYSWADGPADPVRPVAPLEDRAASPRQPKSLQNLLQQLPLPLLLQAAHGEMLFCNRLWVDQVALSPSAVEWPGPTQWQPLDTLYNRAELPLLPLLSALAQEWPLLDSLHAPVTAPLIALSSLRNQASWQLLRFPLRSSPLEPGADDSTYHRGLVAQHHPTLATQRLSLATLPPPVAPDLWLVLALPVRAGPAMEPLVSPPSPAPKAAWLLELSHELKAPLTSLLGLSALLQDPRFGSLNPKQSQYAHLLYQTSRRLGATVHQFLDWFRLDSGQLTLFPAEVAAADVGPQLVLTLQTQRTAADGVSALAADRFTWSLATEVPTLVADPLRLQQMLQHLTTYLLEKADGQTHWGLSIESWGRWSALTVWAAAVHIPAAVQAQLFQDGYGAGEGGDPPAGKTNLGMMLTWHLARLHGGDITFRSSAEGTRFTLLLPAAAPAAQPEPGRERKLLLLAGRTAEGLTEIAALLEGTDYRLAIARSAAELLDKAHRLQPDLLLVESTFWPQPSLQTVQPFVEMPLVWLMAAHSPDVPSWPNASRLHCSDLSEALLPHLQQRLTPGPADLSRATPPRLTLLHLGEFSPNSTPAPSFLSGWLHHFPCRVLEVDDLIQAEALCRVWRPHVMLLDPTIADVDSYLAQLAQLPNLQNRPLVTLTPAHTQAAYQWPDLRVFPCLKALALPPDQAAAQLMQVVAVATAADPPDSTP